MSQKERKDDHNFCFMQTLITLSQLKSAKTAGKTAIKPFAFCTVFKTLQKHTQCFCNVNLFPISVNLSYFDAE